MYTLTIIVEHGMSAHCVLDVKWPTSRPELALTNPISNERKWNNCVIEFCTVAYLKITALIFHWILILQNDRKLMWQNPSTSGKSHDIRAVCKLSLFILRICE